MTAMFYAAQPTVNLKTLIATAEIFQHNPDAPNSSAEAAFVVTQRLSEISERNIPDLISAAEAFDWSGADPTLVYHLNSAREVTASPARPDDYHDFDFGAMVWRDRRTLADLKAAKWAEVKRARSAAEYGGFAWDGSTFDSDAISQARIQGAVQLAGMAPNFSIDWTLADNAVRTLSAADMLAVGAALGLHVATQFSLARVLRAAIESATADQLSEVAWPAN